ncbi:MAG: glycosyltransferase [Candidatus Obscuribacterales bacterium]|nr:glycosyltransferase [Candidatus Obscuribacterales bacterium]
MAEVHIAHWILDLGLGGDAKNLVSLANEQAKWARVSVLTQTNEPGPRSDQLNAQVIVAPDMVASSKLTSWLQLNDPDVLIVHRNGAPNSTETALVEVFHQAGVACFEYNTFARVDAATDHLWTGHIHLSRASLLQYARRRGAAPLDLSNQKAIGYAVSVASGTASDTVSGIASSITNAERQEARKILNVPGDAFVVARLVRPDLRKWDPLPVLAMEKLQKRKKTCLVLRAAPPERHDWVKAKLGNAAVLLEPSAKDADVRRTLAASDVVVNYSVIGETFGLAMAEAMMSGLPVIANSTPSMDNAQIEFCRHNQRGLIANSVSSLAAALMYLSENTDKKEKLALAGRTYMNQTFAPEIVESRLRRFIIASLTKVKNKSSSKFPEPGIDDSYELTESWLSEYTEAENESFPASGSLMERFSDQCALNISRMEDSLLYARKIGLSGIIEKVSRRLSQGSLLRS